MDIIATPHLSPLYPYPFPSIIICCCLVAIPGSAQNLLLPLCLGITLGGLGVPYGMLGTEPGLTACKENKNPTSRSISPVPLL